MPQVTLTTSTGGVPGDVQNVSTQRRDWLVGLGYAVSNDVDANAMNGHTPGLAGRLAPDNTPQVDIPDSAYEAGSGSTT